MTIVEKGECSITVMKDSDDYPWSSLMKFYLTCVDMGAGIIITNSEGYSCKTYDYIYSGRRLLLFFKDNIDKNFKIGNKVSLKSIH